MNSIEKIKYEGQKEKRKEYWNTIIFGFLLILPPIILYFFVKWDPSFNNSEGEEVSIAVYLLIIIYWVISFQIYKYRERSRDRAWQLAQFLSDKWTIEKREEERIKLVSDLTYMHKLKDEYPEVFEDNLLRLP